MRIDLRSEIERFNSSAPIESARTPPASWYTHDAFYELEQATVFQHSWQFVALLSDVQRPGDYVTGQFMRWPYLICRDENQEIKAYFNVCSHHGTCVAKGSGNTSHFVCPYHGWTYDLSGDLKRAPRAGRIDALRERGLNLKPVPVETWGPFIALNFGSTTRSLTEQLGDIGSHFSRDPFKEMQFIRRKTYEIPCNWKVYVDNYLDGGYHVPHMHPALSGQLDISSYHNLLGKYWSIQACKGSEDSDKTADRGLRERLGQAADYAWLYPNFMINRYGPWMDTNWVIPRGPNHCVTIFDYFFEGTPGEETTERALAASHQVQVEDIAITQMVQTGLNSGVYEQGIYAPRFEMPMLHFHRLLAGDLREGLTD